MSVLRDFGQYLASCAVGAVAALLQLVLAPVLFAIERARAGPRKTFKSVLITGGSSGLGAALAVALAGPGVHMAITGRNQQRLDEVAARCRAKGAEVKIGLVDVSDRKGMSTFIDVVDAAAPIDLGIANAGLVGFSESDDEAYTAHDSFNDVTNANMVGVGNTIFPLARKMSARRAGQLAIMSSLSGNFPFQAAPDYSATKAAVTSLGRSLRKYLAVFNVGMTVISPGFVRTELLQSEKKYPFEIKLEQAVPVMVDGLERNVPVLAFPGVPSVMTSMLGHLEPVTLLVLGPLFGTRVARRVSIGVTGQKIEGKKRQ